MTAIKITCPACRTRCQLKREAGKSVAGRGKCPGCGHVFPIPPGLKSTPGNPADEASAGGGKPGWRKFMPPGLALLLIIGGGLFLALQLQPQPAAKAPVIVSSSPPAPAAPPALDPEIRSTIIARIKRHALVGDAGIRREPDRYCLFLLVGRNTPPPYAEELGRQFAFYLERRLRKETGDQVLPIEVSVYYPGGTRLEVACARQDGEEEVLLPEKGQNEEKPNKDVDIGNESTPITGETDGTGANDKQTEKPSPITTGKRLAGTLENDAENQ